MNEWVHGLMKAKCVIERHLQCRAVVKLLFIFLFIQLIFINHF